MENMAYLLIKSSRILKGALDKRLMEYGVTARQFSVLNQIAMRNGDITSAEVAEKLEVDRPTISGVIHRLEKNGLLIKLENPEDRRSAFLALNGQGLEMVEELRGVSDQVNRELFEIFHDDEIADMKSYFMRLMRRVNDLD